MRHLCMAWALAGALGGCLENNPDYCDSEKGCGPQRYCSVGARRCLTDCSGGWCRENSEGPLIDGAVSAVGGRSENDVWVAGGMTLLHFDGTTWSNVEVHAQHGLQDVYSALWVNQEGIWLANAASQILFRQRTDGSLKEGSDQDMAHMYPALHGIWATDDDTDAWAVGDGATILHGGSSKVFSAPSPVPTGASGQDFKAVWGRGGTAGKEVWMVARPPVGGDGTVLRWDGNRLYRAELGARRNLWPLAVSGYGDQDAWFVGLPGLALRADGSITPIDPGYAPVTEWLNNDKLNLPKGHEAPCGVWGTGAHDLWVVSKQGYIGHRDESGSFLQMALPGSIGTAEGLTMHAVWGAPGGNDVWAVGDRGVILHWRRAP